MLLLVLGTNAEQNPTRKMVLLHLLKQNDQIKVLEAKLVEGTPRERFVEKGPQWELLNNSGNLTAEGSMPTPVPLSYDYTDSNGNLQGGILSPDSINFFVRIPYNESADILNFYPAASKLRGPRSASDKIGTCNLKGVLK